MMVTELWSTRYPSFVYQSQVLLLSMSAIAPTARTVDLSEGYCMYTEYRDMFGTNRWRSSKFMAYEGSE